MESKAVARHIRQWLLPFLPGGLSRRQGRPWQSSDSSSDPPICGDPFWQVTNASSYASLVDPDSGMGLKHITAKAVNGLKCAQLSLEDVEDEISYWQTAILCTVLGANPPYEIIKRYIARIWAEFSIDKILMIQKGVFLVRFENLKDKEAVVKRGIYFFHSKPFVVKG